jgi:hypothetical protein
VLLVVVPALLVPGHLRAAVTAPLAPVSGTGALLAYAEENEVVVYDTATGQRTDLPGPQAEGPVWSADGRYLGWLSSTRASSYSLGIWDSRTGLSRHVTMKDAGTLMFAGGRFVVALVTSTADGGTRGERLLA